MNYSNFKLFTSLLPVFRWNAEDIEAVRLGEDEEYALPIPITVALLLPLPPLMDLMDLPPNPFGLVTI